MRFAIVTNASNAVVREFEAADDYTQPAHKFGAEHLERVVRVVEIDPPTLGQGQVLQPTQEVTETGLRNGWVAVAAPVPQEAAVWALKEVCLVRGHASAIEAALNGLSEPTRTIARNRWENKDTISRGSSIISAMQAILGWSNAYVDELFVAAHAL